MKKISVVTPCYNEEGNIEEIYLQVKQIFADLEKYDYEHLFIDNASQDKTVDILKSIAIKDPNIKIIVNARNFGAIRSIYYGIIQPDADAVVLIFADLQDPPDLIVDFIKKWEDGYHIVKGIKTSSEENLRLISLNTGFSLVNRRFFQQNDPHINSSPPDLGSKTNSPLSSPWLHHAFSFPGCDPYRLEKLFGLNR